MARKPKAVGSKGVDVWCLYYRVTVAAQVTEPEVVDVDQQDIRLVGKAGRADLQGQEQEQDDGRQRAPPGPRADAGDQR